MKDCNDCDMLRHGWDLRTIRGVDVWTKQVPPVREPLPSAYLRWALDGPHRKPSLLSRLLRRLGWVFGVD